MGTVPTPHTWVAGTDNATSANMQTLTDGGLYALGSPTSGGSKKPLFEGRQTIAQSLANATWTDITFDVEDVDYDNGHSTTTNTARYTAQTAGWYQLSGCIDFAANASANRRGARWSVNGTAINAADVVLPGVASAICAIPARTIKVFLNVGDYVTLQGFQDTGGSLNTSANAIGQSSMSIEWRSN